MVYIDFMTTSKLSFPSQDYLELVGVIVYTVSYMEWTLIGDLYRLSDELPSGLVPQDMEADTAGAIARNTRNAADVMEDTTLRNFLMTCAECMGEAATIRNDVLHARPATHPDDDQLLQRASVRRKDSLCSMEIDSGSRKITSSRKSTASTFS
ncbi:hypothetical protein [Corynebacterium heidelbergense]|uniref:hypothetical protein n=1 Tax=Corynebacterium heidelbergense TaxID=2055947 RepID=UPI00105788CF|nr:hypothetical protein [Corynebacterium heidelbergense]